MAVSYNVLTDELRPAAARGDSAASLRVDCLRLANETAKLGLAHDVYQTAAKYYAWVVTGEVEAAVDGREFADRLRDLIAECHRLEALGSGPDRARILHDMQVVAAEVEVAP